MRAFGFGAAGQHDFPEHFGPLRALVRHHLPDAYLASDVERVEVIRGPAIALFSRT